MPPVSIKYVVSFSSQIQAEYRKLIKAFQIHDDRHPVTNLLKGDGFLKWLCSPTEKSGQIEAIFQLETPTIISYIDIGSVWCASMEIKVGNSDWPAGREYETLAYTVNLMTPADCLLSRNTNKTQMFSSDLFCPEIAQKPWDRVKVICRQPYKKMTQFGLSFIRVKTSSEVPVVVPNVVKKKTDSLATVSDIQKHFLGKLDNRSNNADGKLKSRLLKIASSSDNVGITSDHDGSLSRTARLVLASSSHNTNTFSNPGSNKIGERPAMFSNLVHQKYAPKFSDEVEGFLAAWEIDVSQLDTVMMADVRHKFEKKLRRKLTKDEKQTFKQMTQTFLENKFKSSTGGKENTADRTTLVNDIKLNDSAIPRNRINNNAVTESPNNLQARSAASKRKIDDDSVTPPAKKVAQHLSIKQQIKSADKQPSAVERKDLICQLKTIKTDSISMGPIGSCVTSPLSSPFQYKGLRGKELNGDSVSSDIISPKSKEHTFSNTTIENHTAIPDEPISSDFDLSVNTWLNTSPTTPKPESVRSKTSQVRRNGFVSSASKSSPGVTMKPKSNLKANIAAQFSPGSAATNSSKIRSAVSNTSLELVSSAAKLEESSENRTQGVKKFALDSPPSMINWSSSDEDDDCDDILRGLEAASQGTRRRGRGRGQTRGRARGKGRGGGAKSTPKPGKAGDLDLSMSPAEVKGRGRGRGKGKGRKKSNDMKSCQPDAMCVSPEPETVQTPRGFSRCSGCGDFFADTLLSVHQLRCAALKHSTPGIRAHGIDTQCPREQTKLNKTNSPFSRETKPTSFVKCDGCNGHYGVTSLAAHQNNCLGWKNCHSNSDCPANTAGISTQSSTWLSSRSPIGGNQSKTANQITSYSNEGRRLASPSESANQSSSSLNRSGNEPIKSPPWLIAAEKRLHKNLSASESLKSPVDNADTILSNRDISKNSVKKIVSPNSTYPTVKSQRSTLPMYSNESESDATNSLDNSLSQSLLGNYSENIMLNRSSSKNVCNTSSNYSNGGTITSRNSGTARGASFVDINDDSDDDEVIFNQPTGAGFDPWSVNVECPLCGQFYPESIIEQHAATCSL